MTFEEALQLAQSFRPLPPALEQLECQGDTLYATVNIASHLPKLLRRASPNITLTLPYQGFTQGVACFGLHTNVASLSADRLTGLLSRLPALRDVPWLTLTSPREHHPPKLQLDLDQLLASRIRGIHVTDLVLSTGTLTLTAELDHLALIPPPPSNSPPLAPPTT